MVRSGYMLHMSQWVSILDGTASDVIDESAGEGTFLSHHLDWAIVIDFKMITVSMTSRVENWQVTTNINSAYHEIILP